MSLLGLSSPAGPMSTLGPINTLGIMWSSVIGSTESIGPNFNSLTVNDVQHCQ